MVLIHLLTLRYTGNEADAAPHVAGHVEYLRHHHDAGTFLVSGQSQPTGDGGAIVARAAKRDTIEAITATDPFVRHGVGEYQIVTIEPGRTHPALDALLA